MWKMAQKSSVWYYAVARGRKTGIFNSWAECEANVKGFPNASFKKFSVKSEAQGFVNGFSSKRKIETKNEYSCRKKFKVAETSSGMNQTLKTSKQEISKCDNNEDVVDIYTDGACSRNGRANPKAGVGVWFGNNHPLNISKPVDGPPTNNTAEIQAARLALEAAAKAGHKSVKLHTDSAFLIQCATCWLPKWKSNGWKLSTGGDVKNRIELEKLDKALAFVTVQWIKVPAHSGIYGNEMADKLATEGATRY